MSSDPIAAITSVTPSRAASERDTPQFSLADLQGMAAAPAPSAVPSGSPGGGAIAMPTAPSAPSPMNLQSLAHQFSQGLQHGFYAQDVHRLMDKLAQSKQPHSQVTAGDVTAELLGVQAKIGIADAFSKISSKLSEGLQTMVVRQG
jgi:hypothetical protein